MTLKLRESDRRSFTPVSLTFRLVRGTIENLCSREDEGSGFFGRGKADKVECVACLFRDRLEEILSNFRNARGRQRGNESDQGGK